MKQRSRRYFTQTELAGVWDRWEKGDSLNAIARDLDRSYSTVQGALARIGGMRPAARLIATAVGDVIAPPRPMMLTARKTSHRRYAT